MEGLVQFILGPVEKGDAEVEGLLQVKEGPGEEEELEGKALQVIHGPEVVGEEEVASLALFQEGIGQAFFSAGSGPPFPIFSLPPRSIASQSEVTFHSDADRPRKGQSGRGRGRRRGGRRRSRGNSSFAGTNLCIKLLCLTKGGPGAQA